MFPKKIGPFVVRYSNNRAMRIHSLASNCVITRLSPEHCRLYFAVSIGQREFAVGVGKKKHQPIAVDYIAIGGGGGGGCGGVSC